MAPSHHGIYVDDAWKSSNTWSLYRRRIRESTYVDDVLIKNSRELVVVKRRGTSAQYYTTAFDSTTLR